MLSHLLIGHLYLSGIWQGLLLRMDKNNNCVSQWDWCTCSNYRHHSRLDNQKNCEDLCDHSRKRRISTLTGYNFRSQHGFGNSEWLGNSKNSESFSFTIGHLDEQIPNVIQQTKLSLDLKVPIIGPAYLNIGRMLNSLGGHS